jgi:uncharacterized membrane protein YoaK (UPF0700 family)
MTQPQPKAFALLNASILRVKKALQSVLFEAVGVLLAFACGIQMRHFYHLKSNSALALHHIKNE